MKTTLILTAFLCCFLTSQAQFGPENLISVDNENASIAIPHDVDVDGFTDIISGSFGGKIVWHRNLDGNGNFGVEQIITMSAIAMEDMVLADFDGDEDMDILYKTNLDKIAWLENEDGVGGFGTEKLIVQNEYPYNVRVGDLDGDGDTDVIAVHYFNSFEERLVWYENIDGKGNFSTEKHIESDYFYFFGVQIADIDNDGDQDIVASTWDLSPGKINLYRNDGLGNFGSQEVLFQFSFSDSDTYKVGFLFLSDLNGDDIKDILFTAHHDDLPDYLGWLEAIDGTGTFSTPSTIHTYNHSSWINTMQPHDLDNDGDQDILLGFANASNYGNLSYILNTDGQGNFGNRVIVTEGIERTRHVTAADIDNDNDLDAIVCSSFGNRLAWYENNGLLNIEENEINNPLLYPNPTAGILYFKTAEIIETATVHDVLGNGLYHFQKPDFIDISTLPAGVYFIDIKTDSGISNMHKIIKK